MTTGVFSNMTQFTEVNKSNAAQTQTEPSVSVKESLPAVKVETPSKSDTVEISTKKEEKKTKRGPIKALKNTIANIKKYFASVKAYTKGFFKGIFKGGIAASVAYTGISIFNKIKKKPENSKLGFIVGGVIMAGSLIASIWNASLDLSEKKSEIDHRWTGHTK